MEKFQKSICLWEHNLLKIMRFVYQKKEVLRELEPGESIITSFHNFCQQAENKCKIRV